MLIDGPEEGSSIRCDRIARAVYSRHFYRLERCAEHDTDDYQANAAEHGYTRKTFGLTD